MSLVSRRVGPKRSQHVVRSQVLPRKTSILVFLSYKVLTVSNVICGRYFHSTAWRTGEPGLVFFCNRLGSRSVLPIASSACWSSSVKVVRGTSSETGRTVTVDRLEAWFPASHLLPDVCRARLRAEDQRHCLCWSVTMSAER